MISTVQQKAPSTLLVVIAFAIVYVVWGSTYFFIQMAIRGIPAMLMGAMRFIAAGAIMLAWCALRGDKIWVKRDVINAAVSGLLLLAVGNGIVIWVEQALPSAMVAIMVSANPIWFVVLDKRNWKQNLRSTATVVGLIIGFAGVILLFGEQVVNTLGGTHNNAKIRGVCLLVIGPIGWAGGSLYSKYKGSSSPARVTTAWQMLIAGIAFLPASALHNEFANFDIAQVPAQAWMAVLYLVFFGSIAAFTAYVWLLQVRPATQVSTHSYVNPVIAVLLGVMFAQEHISWLQIGGLVIILVSVLLINLAKYRKDGDDKKEVKPKGVKLNGSVREVV
ncbi:EamA family transporter [Mucilaginibacter sp. AK015]|uniref:EamA family transporter n=1 Tax=Mucilaginibacter sp. AK015 TaxID=2723072 RepID=UPI001622BE29|nr:EamA family transporter [Mucilaginibacter sp. AK015]MBB5397001.1 drug/metabolite transporter (DMT)-like permease [Mucilaginibacter sp. AK015]